MEKKPKKKHDLVRYIHNEWKLTREKWAFYPRSQNPLLVQIATTNLVESWHNSLKKRSQSTKKTQAMISLLGCVMTINETGLQWDARAEQRRKDFRTRNVSEAEKYKMLKRFPFPVQKLLLQEIRLANQYKADNVPIRESPDGKMCNCEFYQKHYLPCCHIWHRHFQYDILTKDDWENYHYMFKDNGFDVYERYKKGTNTKLIRENLDSEKKRQDTQTLRAREQFGRLTDRWFGLLEEMETWDSPQEKRVAQCNWIDGLTKAIDPFLKGTAKAFLSANYWKSKKDFPYEINVDAAFPEGSRVEERLENEANVRPNAFQGLEVAAEFAEERLEDDYEYSDWSSEDDEDQDFMYSRYQSGQGDSEEDAERESDNELGWETSDSE